VLPENAEMLTVFHDGFASSQQIVGGIAEVEFPTSHWSLAPGGPLASADLLLGPRSPATAP